MLPELFGDKGIDLKKLLNIKKSLGVIAETLSEYYMDALTVILSHCL